MFCSYSHRDDEFRQELETHLSALTRQGLITFWYDRRIVPGDEWKREIAAQLEEADIILLLISAYFVSSDYCYQIELGRALQRHSEGSATVIPIFVRACDWEGLDFAQLQGLPPDGVPVDDYDDHHKAWSLVTKGIRQARINLFKARPQAVGEASLSNASYDQINQYEVEAYLRHLAISYESESRDEGAIQLDCEIDGEVVPVEKAFRGWVNEDSRRLLLLTGDPGAGKTWTFRRLAAELANRILRGESSPQPLYVPFASLSGRDALAAISLAVPEARGVLERLAKRVSTVALLDGIDEVLAQSGDEGVQIVKDFLDRTPKTTRIAVSCRTHVAAVVGRRLQAAGHEFVICAIRDINSQQIDAYLSRSMDVSIIVDSSITFLRNPFMLRMFEDTWSRIDIGEATIGKIYISAIRRSLRAARERDKRLANVPEDTLLSIMTSMTEQMFPRLTIDVGEILIAKPWKTRKLDILNGLIGTGLLILDAREFLRFTHMSLFEFFFALLLHKELSLWNAKHLAMSNLIYSYGINRFLIPMLLADPSVQLSRRARAVRRRLESPAVEPRSDTTPSISKLDFAEFVDDTGWRRDIGFGQWLTFVAADGTLASPDSSIVPERGHITLDNLSVSNNSAAASLSWYDAHQFARWIGGRLPQTGEISHATHESMVQMEWTSEWFEESHGLVKVIRKKDGHSAGVNPDVRSSQVGFRVRLL